MSHPIPFEILLVDDEPRLLDGLRRQLHGHRDHWSIRYATSGDEALALLRQKPADVVVSDMRMPGMDGGKLLQHVFDRYPQTTRIMLSGQTDQADLLRSMVCIHQYLQKPCPPSTLSAAIERTWRLSKLIQVPSLRCAVTKITSLPPADSTLRELLSALDNPEEMVDTIANIIQRDPALTAKLIQIVSSAFFAVPRRIDSVHQAIVMLGVHTVRTLAIAVHLFDFVKGIFMSQAVNQLWVASVQLGTHAENLAQRAGSTLPIQQRARLAGTMALIGRAILASSQPEQFIQAKALAIEKKIKLFEAEKICFGVSQDDLTAYALGVWGMNDDLIAAAACQTHPSQLPANDPQHPGGFIHLARHLFPPMFAPLDESLDQDHNWQVELPWLPPKVSVEAA